MKKIILIGLTSLILVMIVGMPLIASADSEEVNLVAAANNVGGIFRGIVAGLVVVGMAWSAMLFLTSGGDEEKVAQAKMIFIYSVIGIIVYLISGEAINWVQSFVT